MKNIIQVLIFPLVFGLVATAACSDNDEDTTSVAGDQLVGTWQLTSFHYENPFTAGELSGMISADGKDMENVQITFNANGTTSYSGDTFIVVLTTTLGGHSTKKEIPTQPMVRNGTWKKKGNTLTVDHPDNPLGPQEIQITKLDGSTLQLSTIYSSPVPGAGEVTTNMRYTRVD